MKFLCDNISPRVPCALVRGYREMGVPHAWNLVVVKGEAYIIDTLG
jgi:transglutaminase/protease-like cytokinesis protein 3